MTPLKIYAPPLLRLLLTEGVRASADVVRLATAITGMKAHMVPGDGHSVLVLPGFLAGNGSTYVLRRLLRGLGYDAHGWTCGRNLGLSERVTTAMAQQLQDLARLSGGRVSLIGHSLGGLFARELARQHPDLVRQVITLGSPFAGHPRSTNAWRVYQWMTGEDIDTAAGQLNTMTPPPVPVSAIFSRSDGVVAWRGAIETAGAARENIEVRSSHMGMGHHPAVIAVIADRLAQTPGRWSPFKASDWNERFFPQAARQGRTCRYPVGGVTGPYRTRHAMAGLRETLANLKRQMERPAGSDGAGRMSETTPPSGNPGALKMYLYVPPGLQPGAPLVVVLHGCTQSAEGYAAGAGWLTLADRFGFAVLAPEQTTANNPNRCFNWFVPGDISRSGGEAASIARMVDAAVATHDLDSDRVFVTGLSAGGAMTAVMLATYPEMFAAGGIIAGLPYGVARSMPEALSAMVQPNRETAATLGDRVRNLASGSGRWPRVSIWHGTADRTVQPGAAEALARQWCSVHGVSGAGTEQRSASGRRYQAWTSPDGRSLVELHRMPDMGHGAPLKSAGPDGCGSPGPFLLEVGVSSSLELAQSWGIATQSRTDTPAGPAILEPEIVDSPPPDPAPRAQDQPSDRREEGAVLKIINDALRKAGLLK